MPWSLCLVAFAGPAVYTALIVIFPKAARNPVGSSEREVEAPRNMATWLSALSFAGLVGLSAYAVENDVPSPVLPSLYLAFLMLLVAWHLESFKFKRWTDLLVTGFLEGGQFALVFALAVFAGNAMGGSTTSWLLAALAVVAIVWLAVWRVRCYCQYLKESEKDLRLKGDDSADEEAARRVRTSKEGGEGN